jgi:hypothetical protein
MPRDKECTDLVRAEGFYLPCLQARETHAPDPLSTQLHDGMTNSPKHFADLAVPPLLELKAQCDRSQLPFAITMHTIYLQASRAGSR